MPERDANEEALRQIEKATESEPVKGQELLESNDKRRLSEAKKRIQIRPRLTPRRGKPFGEQPL